MNDTTAFGGAQLDAFFPVDEDIGSDSALLDNVVELLLAAGTRELAEVIMMLGCVLGSSLISLTTL